jgi:hypothetical protein
MKKKFMIARTERNNEDAGHDGNPFVAGLEPEVTKTFRIPLRLSRQLKIHAAQTGQTEKDIFIRLLTDYLARQ